MAIRIRSKKISNTPKSPTKLAVIPVPPSDLEESQQQIEEVANRFQRREITLTEDQRTKLEAELALMINAWKDDRSTLIDKLREENDLYEGVTTQTDFPWPGASHLHVPIPKIKAREIKSAINRSVMRPIPFLQANYAGPDTLVEDTADFVVDLENFVEDKIKNSTNIHQVLKDSIIPIIRDGTCPVQIIWETEWETVFDFKTYQTSDEFLVDYQSPEEAHISPESFQKIVKQLNDGDPYEIMYEYEVATYDGPKAYLVPLIHFVHFPVYSPDIRDTVLHGKQIWYSDSKLRQFKRMKKFNNEELIDGLIEKSGDLRDETWTQNRDEIEGITRHGTGTSKAKEYEFYELCYLTSLDDDEGGTRRKYLIYYHHPSRKIHRPDIKLFHIIHVFQPKRHTREKSIFTIGRIEPAFGGLPRLKRRNMADGPGIYSLTMNDWSCCGAESSRFYNQTERRVVNQKPWPPKGMTHATFQSKKRSNR